VGTGNGKVCSSGNAEADRVIYGHANNVGATGSTPTNPLPPGTPVDGLLWSAPAHVQIQLVFINFIDRPATQVQPDRSSLKIGSQVFTPFGKCKTVGTDPYGLVFDNTTLEPVLGAQVTLLKEREDKSFSIMQPCEKVACNLTNPQTVGADGLYSFVVPPGVYKMQTDIPLITDSTKLHPKAGDIYKDIYHGGSFLEDGSIVHLDIPVDADQAKIKAHAPKLMAYIYTVDKATDSLILEGRVSHPFTTVSAYTFKTTDAGQVLPQPAHPDQPEEKTTTDKAGVFKITIKQAALAGKGESFGLLKLEKKPPALAKRALGATLVTAAEADELHTTLLLPPIPQKIEGFLTTSAGNPLPHTTVQIMLPYSQRAYTTAITSDTGFLQIPGDYLPSEPFTLYLPQHEITHTTGAFIASNASWYAEESVKLVDTSVVLTTTSSASLTPQTSYTSPSSLLHTPRISHTQAYPAPLHTPIVPHDTQGTNMQVVQETTTIVRYLIITLLLLILLVGCVVYVKKRKNTE
jgi:hypothetical protein